MTVTSTKSRIAWAPGARRLLATSLLARLPLATFGIALLVHAQHLTGSFAVAGLVAAAYSLSSAASAPQLGRLVDRHGQTKVLIIAAACAGVALIAAGISPRSEPPALLVALGAAAGAASPPLHACVRSLLPALAVDPDGLPALFAFESTLLEVTFILGPPMALGVGALWSTGAALVLSGLFMLAGTLAFAAHPISRRWRPEPHALRLRGGALRASAMRTLVLIGVGTGAVFGATDVGVTSATHALGSTAAAGPLLGIWGVGSLLGGLLTTRLGGSTRNPLGLFLLVAALALTHGALSLATGSVPAIGALILLAGATIAPTVSSMYTMVEIAAPAGTHTEAFSWLLTASLAGSSLGASMGGMLAQTAGAATVFALAGGAGAIAALIAALQAAAPHAGKPKPAPGASLIGPPARASGGPLAHQPSLAPSIPQLTQNPMSTRPKRS